ncbi:NnrU family protein [Acuticoccus mangrovi]|uniref:NnrU family protein n=1 Tax=Acuticoccus mangrovi TaxID=2796142 RepID=A0A934IH77_9HYPH|nr:NnrU family protein [Acuticoccus mangrovi]MBJ3776644.1 NnrU family protein [Acuticoccus mangrovi]
MVLMIVGLAVFLGAHLVPRATGLRGSLVAALGEYGYKGLFSVVSLVGIVMVSMGYGDWRFQGSPLLYRLPTGVTHLALLLMLFASISLVAAYTPSHMRKALKHPMLVAVKLWAFAHLLANGDVASVVLFGAFLAWAVVDRIILKRRERAGVIVRRPFTARWSGDAVAIVVGVIVYVLFVWKLHLWLIGVSPLPMGAVS